VSDFILEMAVFNRCMNDSLYPDVACYSVYPFYQEQDDKSVQAKLKANQTAFIDPRYRNRSFGESKLVEIIERCWVFNPDKRIDIFELVQVLREVIKENDVRESQQAKMRESILAPHVLASSHR
jgi:hypothetical protein